MKFNVRRYMSGPGEYALMSKKQLAFHEALHKQICVCSRDIVYFGDSGKTLNLNILIDCRTGEMRPALLHRYKNEKAYVRLSDIEGCLKDLLYFVEICAKHGYLLYESIKED